MIKKIVNYNLQIKINGSKPDCKPKKLLDSIIIAEKIGEKK